MAGVFRKAMVWLGLAPDDEYDDYGFDDSQSRLGGPVRPPAGYGQQAPMQQPGRHPQGMPEPEHEAYTPRPAARPGVGTVRPLPARGGADPRVSAADPRTVNREPTPTVRPMRPTSAKPTVVSPSSFDDAKDVADRFKADQPVVMDLSDADKDLARRLIDFSSGICYALGGSMEKVSPGVYLISPSGVEVSDEERRRLRNGR